jgi:hypothetical protein
MSNVKAMPISGQCNSNSDVSEFLRLLADQIEQGLRSDIRTAIVTFEVIGDRELVVLVAGQGGTDNARVLGLLTLAQQQYMGSQ